MAAEFASPRPIAAIADCDSSASPCQPESAAVQDLSDRRNRALAQLEAVLEGRYSTKDEQHGVWTAFREMLDAVDQPSLAEQAVADQSLVEQPLNPQSVTSPVNPPSVTGLDFETSPTWTEVVIVFGQAIRRIRQAQGLSLEQIHFNTQVPCYQLRALESGSVSQLPEEIFVRGFLTRICAQLGAEGQALLAQLPALQPNNQRILADWQQPSQATSGRVQILHLRPSHLYVSYAALLAGAAGGLTLSVQEAAQMPSAQNSIQTGYRESSTKAKLNPVQRAVQFAFGSDVARPEQSAPETEK